MRANDSVFFVANPRTNYPPYLYMHSRAKEVKNDYREAKDVQSTVGGIDKGETRDP